MCRETFERIAREGRKFGLGLVLSSQRPSELSPTALAQCNTFLLHRIVNDRDQQLVARLVPDNLGELLRDLPNLPSRPAILLGWATPVPVLVEINELPLEHRPRSSDPRFWAVWTGADRPIDWRAIAADWSGTPVQVDEEGA
jgi:DNA helicase HerA-like ATPase